jgi:hypothetical protein
MCSMLDSMYVTMSTSTGLYPNLDLLNANKLHYITIKLHSAMTLLKFHCPHPTATFLQKLSHAGASSVFSFLIRQGSELPNYSWAPKMYQKYVCSSVCHYLRWICTRISIKAWHSLFVCLFLEPADWGYRSIRFDGRQWARTNIGKLVNIWTSTSARVSSLRPKS